MRFQVKTCLGRLCLMSLLWCGTNANALAHDLPSDRNLPLTATANCFAEDLPKPCMTHDTCPVTPRSAASSGALHTTQLAAIHFSNHYRMLTSAARQAWASQHVWSAFSKSSAEFSQWWKSSNLSPARTPAKSVEQLLIARPDNGTAPSPRLHKNSLPANKLAQILKYVDEAQCQIYAALHDRESLTRALAQAIASQSDSLLRNLVTFALPNPTQIEQANLFVGPQFVIFGLNNQGHVLLTVAQAQQWQFAVPQSQIDAAKLFSQRVMLPLQQHAVAVATQQLDRAGHALLDLSQSLSQLSNSNVAQRRTPSSWK